MDQARYQVRLSHALSEVSAQAWNRVANPPGLDFDPFVSWEFLEALERSEAVGGEAGWLPHHLIAEGPGGEIAGAMPLYLKSHSYGEFVFDHNWADAFQRSGGRYYPKLLCAVPFTPVTGRRLLVSPGPDAAVVRNALVEAALGLVARGRLSSLHVNFPDNADLSLLSSAGCLVRHDQQFQFFNRGYRDFGDFLASLSSEKRKNLRKERAKAADGVNYRLLTGADIRPEHWDAFFLFYMDTGARKWGTPYLNRETFALVGERLADHVLLVMAYEDGVDTPIAGALNLIGSKALYGRYWGTVSDRPFLHFETCYYQAMDWAIARGLERVEAGAQGGHKLARGYEPVRTQSAHWIAHAGFREAVADFLKRERELVARDHDWLASRTPFRKGPTATDDDGGEEA
jgi:predicted N-acyltransferase